MRATHTYSEATKEITNNKFYWRTWKVKTCLLGCRGFAKLQHVRLLNHSIRKSIQGNVESTYADKTAHHAFHPLRILETRWTKWGFSRTRRHNGVNFDTS